MGVIEGSRTVEIDAPLHRCFDIAADIERARVWMHQLREVRVVERNHDGRPSLVETVSDAKVKAIKALLRFSYHHPVRIEWVQEKGDTKSLRGAWRFADLGGDRTQATYELVADPGRMLGLLLHGPAEARIRDILLGGAAEGLKAHAEAAA